MHQERARHEHEIYAVIRNRLQEMLEQRFSACHLEITADKSLSNVLKAQIDRYREIVFHFLKEARPDIAGFVTGVRGREFIVIEVKNSPMKLDDVYQVKKYAELLNAPYALLVSTEQIPEELRRLYETAPAVLSTMAGYGRVTLVSFSEGGREGGWSAEWFPGDPFE